MSDKKAVDVLDSSYPLLMTLREKCPGTYTHSKNVASLLEALSVELKLDTHKLRIAGQYHDIGKVVNPSFFYENLVDESNPHDGLDPEISHKIITAHVGNTAQILINDPNIPVDVIRWCTQHHGNSVTLAFFNKAFAKNSEVQKNTYRYGCSVPDSLESGLVMISDCLEAKCKALYQKEKPPEIKKIVTETFEDLSDDLQLDEIQLPKMSYIRIIKQVLTRELSSIYQSKRVDYDEDKK